ncbi:uncharacterized protein LOC129915103 [Episyrphus balteatus]|uniref:uncharacterized protein LOC129915103 n=1 Tax=Episyrphus balteatus TaxID=286459 RepID=UPI00248611A2|nr:uncharacterized protein LOC129915103 [Episyrphus balteatus]
MSKLGKIIETQELRLKEFQNDYEQFCEKIGKDTAARSSKGFMNTWLVEVENTFKLAKKDHTSIVNNSADPAKEKYLESETFTKIKLIYFDFNGKLQDLLDEICPERENTYFDTSRLNNTTKSSVCEIKLKRIEIKPFSGDYEDWFEFQNMFESMVHHNVDLSDIQKLQYLLSSLAKTPLELISHLPIEGKSYSSAWEILVDRYKNTRKLVNAQIRRLMEQQKHTHESASGLKSLHDVTTSCIHALANLNIKVDAWDCILIYVVYQKLPLQTQKEWEFRLGTSKVLPDWKTFAAFLQARFSSLEQIYDDKEFKHPASNTSSFRKPSGSFHTNKQFSCRLCKADHGIRFCRQFSIMGVKARIEAMKRNSICSNCLGYDHHSSTCSSSNRCIKCGLKHHTMLHIETQQNRNNTNLPNTSSQRQNNNSAHHQNQFRRQGNNYENYNVNLVQNPDHFSLQSSEQENSTNPQTARTFFNNIRSKGLLATARVKVFAPNGTAHVLRALIDPGSEISFVTENVTQLLKLKKEKTLVNVTGLGQTLTGTSKSKVDLTIYSMTNPLFSLEIQAFVLSQLTTLVPTQEVDSSDWIHLDNLSLADPWFSIPGKIDLLLGADVYASIILEGLVKKKIGSPVAQQTELGWILTGSFRSEGQQTKQTVQNHFNAIMAEVRRFWEIEENLDYRKLTLEEEKCQQHYNETFQRKEDGRYEVQLPFKNNIRPILGDSKRAAMARFFQLEKRMAMNKKLKDEYSSCINEYLTMGHMKEVTSVTAITEGNHYYLPHHAVFKESTTTKLRVVFDASCPTSTGLSLNDHLMVGPRLQRDIIDLIAQWRKFKIAFAADISKMYRQIWMAPKDTIYQLILWRDSDTEPIKTFALNTVTFGTASAPYLAVRTLQQIALDVENTQPHVAKAINEGFYVDDFLYGSDNEADATTLQRDVLTVLNQAGFPLRKWASNSSNILVQIPKTEREVNLPMDFDSTDSIKTLGIQWHPAKDVFTFKINLPNTDKYTKRSVLADISRLFDPLGWIAPCIIKAKLLMQQLWVDELSWDSTLPDALKISWLDLRNNLKKLEEIQIPRWINFENSSLIQLHGFCDASEKAYAAVIYARVVKDGEEVIHLIASKTRVAPIKSISLPRLELCAALLLAKLIHRISRSMQLETVDISAWSDSMITLAWIRGSPSLRTTFVANRVAEIQSLTETTIWHHVNGKENPADIVSRGLSPKDVIDSEMWWHGPPFLKNFVKDERKNVIPIETDLETKRTNLCSMTIPFSYQENVNISPSNIGNVVFSYLLNINPIIDKYSTLKRLVRSVAIWRRYFYILLHKDSRKSLVTHPLQSDELISTQNQIIKFVQKECFPEEISSLENKKSIPKSSHIRSLNPFIASDGMLRVGGRLTNSTLSFNQQHPVILKNSHPFVKLLISDIHQSTLHGGQQIMMATIRNLYWITNVKRTIKSVIYHCVRCHRYNAKVQEQLMGSLPAERVIASRPFTNTGVDYAGPIEIKMWKGKCNKFSKGYIAVFVCMSTKAIHIELVSDLSSVAFIAAFRRFVARRGSCANMFSDCGTNFKGANNEMRKDSKFISSEWSSEVSEALAAQNTKWHFNPPSSPHFGGLWEAGVKSIKFHLKRTIGCSKLTFEEHTTLLAQIEACLNSRPLCPMSSDPDDLSVLTPGHFLIGAPLCTLPERNLMEHNINALNKWKYLQRLKQEFWKQWSSSYLHHLQQRPKWLNPKENLKVGDIVLVKEDNLPPSAWLLARVIELHPGADGFTRVVTIKTKNSILKRPISKLSRLPICDPSNSNK